MPFDRVSQWGSSPLTRGTPDRHADERRDVGIIPAYAGNTSRPRFSRGFREDHPRLRGEHRNARWTMSMATGSSPLTRGTPRNGRDRPCSIGNHPRLRGEHRVHDHEVHGSGGSSPLTRGTLGGQSGDRREVGIIPAYAGNTCPRCASGPWTGDHPRLRGEHYTWVYMGDDGRGSSPLTRGTRVAHSSVRDERRIIPAYAGNTMFSSNAVVPM